MIRPQDPAALAAYRPNAGIVLFNREGLTWIGRRYRETGQWVWQWPQGGMDAGEDPQAAAYRELYEETGIRSDQVELLGSIGNWLSYDFPPEVLALRKKNWKGQRQRWFAFRFLGTDADFDLTAVPPQEFEAFRWETLERVPELIIPWKRAVYEDVVSAFSKFSRP
ncbi:RNA pyrophosphohydrolase [Glycocaulis albus]|jgi:putative (di)nucleoside polyphosphate hydrolase|uniref:RNA pyrophosphohydrolase n=1 Tax=Glycocaulis albus TaxID=1382801 RepID=A0ABQ1XJE8_9PROT|nr:RNA pyrophosphohydrolase [Glycocaulis albus]MBV5259183.1 RNA pyrophosphohydrolase [Synechococcus moorigangaii CMS01]GGG95288.1 RNA pyrophosphohydrolase [Glycocaulis albus]